MANDFDKDSILVNVKRVTEAKESGRKKDQDRVMFGIGVDSDGTNQLDKLLDYLERFRGKQVNLDFRITNKEGKEGREFRSAFLIAKEYIPKDDPRYKGDRGGKKSDVKEQADRIRAKFGK